MARKITLGNLTLSWHERNGQWRKSIGFKPDKAGVRRVPAEFYFGAEESAALLAAAGAQERWREVVANWESLREGAELLYPNMDTSLPFWLDDEGRVAEAEAASTGVLAERPGHVTIERARARYEEHLRGRIKLMGKRGLKQSTLNTILANLACVFAASDSTGKTLLPATKNVQAISYADTAAMINFFYQRGKLSERSALNYCRAFQAFMDWMDNQPDMAFRKPKGVDSLFKLGKPQEDPKIPTAEQVRAIFAACATDAERLYVLLGINCGMYESDISALTPAADVTHGGERCLWWRREKTSHQNTFYTLHWLFPETVALLDTERAPANAHHRLLLDPRGNPLSESRPGYRTKLISGVFPRILKRAKLGGSGMSFKSLRKFGANEVRSHALQDKDNTARMFLGQAIPGVLRSYVKDDFTPLSEALRGFRERLLAAGVFPPAPHDTSAGQAAHRSASPRRVRRRGSPEARR